MKSYTTSRAVELLLEDVSVNSWLTAPAEAIVMPFANEHNKHYLCLTLPVSEEAVSPEVLAPMCSRIVSVLALSGVLENLEGLELFLGAKKIRLLRLSVLSSAIERAKHLTPEDLKGGTPFEGSTCIVYQPWA